MTNAPVDNYAFSFKEMCKILGVKGSTLKRRIYTRSNVPPFQKIGDEYIFPKEIFQDWVKALPLTFEVKGITGRR